VWRKGLRRCTMSVNRVLLCGHVSEYGPKIEWTPERGRPQTSFTLVLRDGDYKTFVPVLVVGAHAEAAAETLAADDMVVVDGKLSWKSGKTKDAGKLVVVCFAVEVVQAAAAEAVG
jgi:hypothetical protein